VPEAQCNLAVIYAQGKGVTKNNAEAIKWFRKSSDQGYAQAQYGLGIMYFQGLGVPKNLVQAYMWWYLSGSQGNLDAEQAMNSIKGKMTPAQISEATKLAGTWKPKK
jgi:TPR repeat protein